MRFNNIIPYKWEAWFAPMGEDADYSANDIFKTYFGTYRYAEKKASKDRPNGYELIELVKPLKLKKKRRKLIVLAQCLYKPCEWHIYNNKISSVCICSLIDAIKLVFKEKMGFVHIKLWADFKEMDDPDWLPF